MDVNFMLEDLGLYNKNEKRIKFIETIGKLEIWLNNIQEQIINSKPTNNECLQHLLNEFLSELNMELYYDQLSSVIDKLQRVLTAKTEFSLLQNLTDIIKLTLNLFVTIVNINPGLMQQILSNVFSNLQFTFEEKYRLNLLGKETRFNFNKTSVNEARIKILESIITLNWYILAIMNAYELEVKNNTPADKNLLLKNIMGSLNFIKNTVITRTMMNNINDGCNKIQNNIGKADKELKWLHGLHTILITFQNICYKLSNNNTIYIFGYMIKIFTSHLNYGTNFDKMYKELLKNGPSSSNLNNNVLNFEKTILYTIHEFSTIQSNHVN